MEALTALPAEVQAKVAAGVRFCQELVDIAAGVEVTNDAEYEDLGLVLRKLSAVEKDLDAQRDAVVRPMNVQVRAVNDAFRAPLRHVEMLRVKIKSLMAAYQVARAAEQRRLLEAAAQVTVTPPAAAAALVVQAAAATPPQVEGISTRKRWVWTVVDPAQVPRDFLAVDAAAVQAAVRAGRRDIPGIKIEQVTEVAARAG